MPRLVRALAAELLPLLAATSARVAGSSARCRPKPQSLNLIRKWAGGKRERKAKPWRETTYALGRKSEKLPEFLSLLLPSLGAEMTLGLQAHF